MNRITATQIRMAKAATDLSNRALEKITGLHRNTISSAATGKGSERALGILEKAFTDHGVKFIDSGVIYRKAGE